jgi:uncharacterized protein YcfJ
MHLLTKSSLSLLILGAAVAAQAAEFEDYARVVSVAPQIEQINQPRQECRDEVVTVQREQRGSGNVGGGLLGGLAGGLLGSQVGGGNGKTAATAVGAIAGAIAGDRMQNGATVVTTEQQPVRQCRTVDHFEQRTVGYLVTYEYRGHTDSAVLSYNPGDRLKLHVALTPR